MFLCIDVGNSRIKAAAFRTVGNAAEMAETSVAVAGRAETWPTLDDWLSQTWPAGKPNSCCMVSVERTVGGELVKHLASRHGIDRVNKLAWRDLPLEYSVGSPETVGVDRLAAALAAHRLVKASRAAIVIDFGSAITVDRVSAAGQFEGGAILPGLSLAAEVLHHRTDALPHVQWSPGDSPDVPGRSTQEAITAGLYWGTIGGVRELVAQLAVGVVPEPAVFVTGGAAEQLAECLGMAAQYEPDLVLRGAAVAASHVNV